MGLYKFIKQAYKKQSKDIKELQKERLILFRKQASLVRIENPSRIDKARQLGYKAKQGFVVVRSRVKRSKRLRPLIKKGRRSKHRRRKKIVNISYQRIAEERTASRFKNLEVLNSYLISKDGNYKWYEIILVDPTNPVIRKDKDIKWITNPQHRGRTFRGLTSAGKKSRGLLSKGKGSEKIRPSLGSHLRKAH